MPYFCGVSMHVHKVVESEQATQKRGRKTKPLPSDVVATETTLQLLFVHNWLT